MGDFEVTPEDERTAEEIEREVREHPIRSALPESRARSLYGRILGQIDIGMSLDELMEERRVRLDEAAIRKEHESP